MKKVFSSLLLIFVFPFRQFKKIFKNNFLSGLILGAIFSLVVNVLSMQLQGAVEKQRILEAIEQEIADNMIKASSELDRALNQQKKPINANAFVISQPYSRDLWEQSTEPLQYVGQLDSKKQILIHYYYVFDIPFANSMTERSNFLYLKSMEKCFDFSTLLSSEEQKECNLNYSNYLTNNWKYIAKDVYDKSTQLLKIFHPTQDRLNNSLLKFLMGNESMKVLSGK